MSSSSLWFYSYVKIRFFNRFRRFLRSKSPRKRRQKEEEEVEVNEGNYDPALVLQRTMKSLHFGNFKEREMAAKVIEKLLIKENVKIRKLMVDLGVIPALVSMVDSDHMVPVKALIELANHNFVNKALMVEEGILSKLPNNTQFITMDYSSIHEFALLLSSLSSLANNQLFLSSTQTIISFLLTILNSESNTETETDTKNACLATLFNISTILENAGTIISNGAIPTLLNFSSAKEFSEKALLSLGNLVITLKGKQALENDPKFPGVLVEILTWEEKPKCQELSAYIIMILAHRSSRIQRGKLIESGIVSPLLELALLGSPLAQKRALKLLQWFKDERQARVGPHSGPQTGRVVGVCVGFGSDFNEEIEKGKKMMRNLVKQSLCKNMEMITQRANSGDCLKIRTLVCSHSSKSLPF